MASITGENSTPSYIAPSLRMIENATLIKQGAEAKVYTYPYLFPPPSIYWPESSSSSSSSSSTPSAQDQPTINQSDREEERLGTIPIIIKHRFPKQYRHPTLDASLTKTRLSFEARALARCNRTTGVVVPKLYWVDEIRGVLGMEKVEGWSVREILGGGAEGETEDLEYEEEEGVEVSERDEIFQGEGVEGLRLNEEEPDNEGMRELRKVEVKTEDIMRAIGTSLGKLHSTGLVHGDLTTSNMMVRLTPDSRAGDPFEIVIIDFGLSNQALLAEHYAVDLYVLERAFASTHPSSEGLYAGVLEAYAIQMGEKKWKPIEARLQEVRLRGRKRDMTG